MPLPFQQDLYATDNADFRCSFQVFDLDDDGNDVTPSSAAASAKIDFRLALAPAATIALANVGSDIQGVHILDAANWIFAVKIDKATLEGLGLASLALDLLYDLAVVTAASDTVVPVAGTLHINWGPTR